MKQYLTVPGPQNITLDRGGNAQQAVDTFASIINQQAQGGWSYHSMESIAITQKPGCIGQPVTTYYYMLVFEREA